MDEYTLMNDEQCLQIRNMIRSRIPARAGEEAIGYIEGAVTFLAVTWYINNKRDNPNDINHYSVEYFAFRVIEQLEPIGLFQASGNSEFHA